jgi:hypothetical protein
MTPQAIRAKLTELLQQRGKKGADRMEMIEAFKYQHFPPSPSLSHIVLITYVVYAHRSLSQHTKEPAQWLKIKIILVATLFDLARNTGAAMKQEHWKRYVVYL